MWSLTQPRPHTQPRPRTQPCDLSSSDALPWEGASGLSQLRRPLAAVTTRSGRPEPLCPQWETGFPAGLAGPGRPAREEAAVRGPSADSPPGPAPPACCRQSRPAAPAPTPTGPAFVAPLLVPVRGGPADGRVGEASRACVGGGAAASTRAPGQRALTAARSPPASRAAWQLSGARTVHCLRPLRPAHEGPATQVPAGQAVGTASNAMDLSQGLGHGHFPKASLPDEGTRPGLRALRPCGATQLSQSPTVLSRTPN